MPATPNPVTARPIIRVVLFWLTPKGKIGSQTCAGPYIGENAIPQIKLPSSKIAMHVKYTALMGKYLNALPHSDWAAATVRNSAEAYHPTSLRLWNSSVILGIAVAMMVFRPWGASV